MDKTRICSKHYKLLLRAILLLIVIWYVSTATAVAQSHSTLKPNPLAEKWVLEQVAAGQTADLLERFPKEQDRVLSASFIEKLLTTSIKSIVVPRQGVRIRNAVFVESIDLENAEIPCETWLIDSHFEDKINLPKSIFRKNLSFDGSSFNEANFSSMKVEHTASFNNATFAGLVDFTAADIGLDLEAKKAQFTSSEQEVIFEGMKVGRNALFEYARFAGPVNARIMDIGVDFKAYGVQFTNSVREVTFHRMKVGQSAFFQDAVFAGPADFTFVDIGINFEANEAKFTNTEEGVWFNSMKVGRHIIFDKAVFAGPVDFEFVDIGFSFKADNVQFINFGRETILNLGGMTYKHISMGAESDSWKKLLDLVNHSAYNVQVYTNLEDFFRRQGYSDRAHEVVVAQKRRERKEILRWDSVWWWLNPILEALVLYGCSPGRILPWGAGVVFIGWFVFRRKEGMVLQKGEDVSSNYSGLWYSLDLFLPGIDLHTANVWIPKPTRQYALHYMRVHRLLGWLIIPVGLLAFTGIIKP